MDKKILIIGSGASGIACATKLYENGFKNIQILEAENRIGGRINTVPYAANVVDMGAQWCHGEKDNVVFDLANKHNLLEGNTFTSNNLSIMKSNGQEFSNKIAQKLYDLIFGIVWNNNDEMSKYEKSLGEFVQEKFHKAMQSEEYSNIDRETANQFLDFMQKYGNSYDAADSWFDISAKGRTKYKTCEGNQLLTWKDKGYITVLDLLIKKLPNPSESLPIEDKILFNKEVVKINWSTTDNNSAVRVTCSDNTAYEADHVISTMSLGVLKERKDYIFEPILPIEKLYAIDGLILGTVDKIYLEFAEPFWEDKWAGISLIWNKEDLDEIKKSPTEAWLEDVIGFYPVDYQPNIICGWISGKNTRIMESFSENDVTKAAMGLLRRFLGKPNLPDPMSMKRSQWYINPNFRGSYTFRSMKSERLGFGPSHLAEPLTNPAGRPVLQFAGEATHDYYYGTVHGAIESGWRDAKRIIDLYK